MNQPRSQFRNEFAIVPSVARVLAVLAFILVQIILLGLVPQYCHGSDVPPPGVMPLISVAGGFVLALIVLLIGYINADARRRGMSPTLWTLMVIFVPNALGFLVYFLLRKPLVSACPNCHAPVGTDFRYCPKCGYTLAPTCNHCGRAISRDYVCCPYCGKTVGPV